MTVTNMWVGATTPSGARVVGKITSSSASLLVADNSALLGASAVGPVTATADGVVAIELTGLAAGQRYWYGLDDGASVPIGTFRTLPAAGSEASFTLGASSCAGADDPADVVDDGTVLDPLNVSNHPVFATIRQRALAEEWLGFIHLGDFHYYNLGGSANSAGAATVENYRHGYDDVLLQPRQQALYRDVPITTYTWDDHDYGPNNSDETAPGRLEAQQVYRERVPSYDLPVQHDDPNRNAPIYHSFEIGRVLFIVSDARSSRTPISATDDENKTLLGADQKTWMRDTLIASDAEFFVWLMSTPFVNGGSWASYSTESAELVDMFTQLGWIDRMCTVTGDAHYLAIDTGTGAAIGGIPVFVFSSLDSGAGGSSLPYDTGDVSGGKARYGTIEVVDNGDILHVTGRGYIDALLWREHTITVAPSGDDGGDGGPAPRPDIAVPVPRQRVTWLACDLISGRIITELPDITGNVKRVLGAHTSVGLSLPIPTSGPGALGERALQATAYGRVFICPVVNDVPSGGFIVLTRKGGTDAKLDLGCVSLEGYLNRRYVPSMNFPDADEAEIATQLVKAANVNGIGYEIDAPRTGTRRTREYVDSDDATIYKRLRELMGVEGGPEWTVDVDWADDSQRSVAKIFRLRKRIGRVREHAVFDTRGGSNTTYTYTEDYSDGRGANFIVATSSGEGADRPEGNSAEATDEPPPPPNWPLYEQRITPSTSIKDESVLVDHARAEYALTKDGSKTFQLQTRWDATPRLNLDWALGDTVSWDVIGHRHPDGIRAGGRVIAWDLDMQSGTVQPILLDRQEGLL